jgi:hypothetical protein
MRWFFLIFIVLLAVLGNAIVFTNLSWQSVLGAIAFNTFAVSMLTFWWASYFSNTEARARCRIVGHALLMLAAGMFLAIKGASAVLASHCSGVFSYEGKKTTLQFAAYLDSLGLCHELGIVLIVIGVWLAYPSVRLFIGIAR